jgi:hypothetical protein
MPPPWEPPSRGALDDTAWPERLCARAVLPDVRDDRLHGYAMLGDVARHYSYSDLVYLAIVGELPDREQATRFRVGLFACASLSVAEAPAHVAVLSRICGGTIASALAAGTIALVDQVRCEVARHAALIAWLADQTGAVPDAFCDRDPAHAEWMRALLAALDDCGSTLVRPEMSRGAARIALVFEAGLRRADQIEAAIVAARSCGLIAEALATGAADLRDYPVKLPPFHYVDDGSER